MEPISVAIMTALLAGGAKAAEQAVVDAYNGLKALIQKKYGEDSKAVQAILNAEEEPDFKPNQDAVEQRLQQVGADQDPEVAQAAKLLLDELKKHPETVKETGVEMEDIEGAALRIKNVAASGTGVSVKRGKFSGDIDISGVRAGVDDNPKE